MISIKYISYETLAAVIQKLKLLQDTLMAGKSFAYCSEEDQKTILEISELIKKLTVH